MVPLHRHSASRPIAVEQRTRRNVPYRTTLLPPFRIRNRGIIRPKTRHHTRKMVDSEPPPLRIGIVFVAGEAGEREQPMTGLSDPAVSFVLVLLIGIVAGLIAHRISRVSWLSHITGSHRAAVTNVLVGVAGAFVGYHIAVLLRLGGSGSLVPANSPHLYRIEKGPERDRPSTSAAPPVRA